jgi:SAM-dependent methyltransferase
MDYSGERLMPGMLGEGATEHLHRYVLARKIATGLDVLDVACGEGYGSALLSQVARKVIGIDIDSETVSHAKNAYQAANLEFHHGDCARLPLDDACVDLVVSFETIEHHDQHTEMIREIRRVLRPDGVLLISSPNRPEFNRDRSEPYPFHIKELDYGEFDALLRAEFRNVEFYAQRSQAGSLAAPLHDQDASFTNFDKDVKGVRGLSRPIYFLALASNAALPKLGASVFENHQAKEFFKSVPIVREIRAYFAGKGDSGYDQARSHGVSYPENGKRQAIKLSLQANSDISKVRLDLSNAPSAILVHGISLYQGDGAVLWAWDGATSLFTNIRGLSVRSSPTGLLFLCLNDDPQFDLLLPREFLTGLQPSACLVVELTPRPLLEVVSDVLGQDDRLIAELRADSLKSTSLGTPLLTTGSVASSLHLASDLENVTALLKDSLAQRDQTIAQQSMQFEKMREELLRAEAQLDLLKDIMLGGRDEDRL